LSDLCDALCKSLECKACCENYDNLMGGVGRRVGHNKTARSIPKISLLHAVHIIVLSTFDAVESIAGSTEQTVLKFSISRAHLNVPSSVKTVSENIINSKFMFE
jgi:hypothetical protein